ncbi:MAG: hypothetical protein RH948_10985 [Cyclobacteriaceae bacterium]
MRLFRYIIFGWVVALFSCNDEQQSPISNGSDLIAISYTEAGFIKTLFHDDKGRLIQIHYLTTFSDDKTLESNHNFVYNTIDHLTESSTDTGFRLVYTYGGNKIIRTDEYLNGEKSDFHTFSYDERGRIIERITYQDIPEEGGEIPVSKETYQYDQNDNVILQTLYYYTSFGEEARLLSEFEFSNYDNKINSEEFFDIIGINPLINLRKNNPGLMILKNDKGNSTITEKYSYTYHEKGYPIRKVVDVTYYDGTTGSYEATYTFKE